MNVSTYLILRFFLNIETGDGFCWKFGKIAGDPQVGTHLGLMWNISHAWLPPLNEAIKTKASAVRGLHPTAASQSLTHPTNDIWGTIQIYWKIMCWFNSIYGHHIATNFCTCHDSIAVVTCAKFHDNLCIITAMTTRLYFPFILYCERKIISGMGTETQNRIQGIILLATFIITIMWLI